MLTRLGIAMCAVAVAAFAGAWLLGYPELAVLGSAAALAVVWALAWTLPAPRLAVHREIAPAKVARGDPAIGVLRVTNTGRRLRAAVSATDACAGEPVSVEVPRLPPGRTRTVSYQVPTGRRGEVGIGPLRIERGDPFGLLRRVRDFGETRTLLVRPRTVALPLLPSGHDPHLEGPTSDTAPAGIVTFHALREYVLGDDLRHIHWKTTARTGTLMVRQMVDASLPHITVAVDVRPGGYRESEFELAVDAAASVAVAAARDGFPVHVLAGPRTFVRTRGGRDDVEVILDALACLEVGRDEAGTLAIDAIRQIRTGGSLIVVSGELTPAELGALGAVRRKFDRAILIRVRPGPKPPPGIVAMDIGDLGELLRAWRREAAR